MNEFEIKILDGIQNIFASKFLDTAMPIITKLGDGGIFWIALAIFLIIFPKYRKIGISMGVALLIGFLIGNMTLKPLIGRIRPYDVNTSFEVLVKHLSDCSFPSGHTLASFEGAVVLMLTNKKLGIPALVLAFLIAFSRLYLYVHYPTDVIAGAILGSLFAILAVYIVNKIYERKHLAA